MRKLSESIWSDIQDRSTGETTRKEDDVNLMDKEEFCGYLQQNYKMLNAPYDIIVDKDNDGVCVTVYKLKGDRYCYLHLSNFEGDKCIELTDLYNKHMRDLLYGTYKVTVHPRSAYFIIEPYDSRKITNKFFIEVLDFLIKVADHMHNPCLKKKTSIRESIWSDIQDRSTGETIRKEDEVDNLDRDGFYDYLLSHYDIKVSSFFKPINDEVKDYISIPLSYDVLVRMITFDFKHNIIYVPMGTLYYKDLFINTARNFFVTADSDDNPVNYIINPKDKSKPTNKFFLNVLDFLIKEINDKTLLIHKSVNESIWSDIQDRSTGQQIRKEDDIEHLDRDGMFEYIYDIYEQDPNTFIQAKALTSGSSDDDQYFSLPMFVFDYSLYRLAAHYINGKISRIILFANSDDCQEFYKELTDNFKVFVKPNGAREIEAKDGTISNKLLLDVIDVISTNAKKPILRKKEN